MPDFRPTHVLRPVVVHAEQLTLAHIPLGVALRAGQYRLTTPYGFVPLDLTDWVVRQPMGHLHVVPNEAFRAIYETVSDADALRGAPAPVPSRTPEPA